MYKDFTEMPVWQNALEIGEMIFRISSELPKKEDYGLTSQIRRAAVSISANIAEAFGRTTPLDKSKFYDYARASAFETKSLLIYGNKVGYFDLNKVEEINQKLSAIIFDINKVRVSLANKKLSQK
ncbi:MAG: four helix bundle protein [Sphingobacteriaceae bacterium]|nr:four helix bundle protein [Sphingobacteriaceae bacterium]